MSELPKAVRKNGGVDVTGRRRVNLLEGDNVTLTVTDDPTNSETDVTIAASDDTVVVRKNSGSDVGTRPRINFIEGAKVTLTVADDPGNGEVDITVAASDDTVIVRKNSGANVGTRQRLNFIEGSNVTLTVADDPGSNEVDITVAAASAPTDTIVVRKNSGADVGTRPRLNFIEGSNVTLTVSDDIVDGEVDVEISSSASLLGIAEPYNYYIYKSGATYYARNGVTGVTTSNASFSTLYQSLVTALGATGGIIVLAPRTTFTVTAALLPTTMIQTIGCGETTILQAAAGITPIFSFQQYEGTNSRQEKNHVMNMKVDCNDVANSVAFEIHNLKDTRFEKLWIKGVKANCFEMSSTAIGNSFWNLWRDIQLDCSFNVGGSSPTACGSFLHVDYNSLDSWVERVFGTGNYGVGFRFYGCNVFTIKDYWVTGNLHVAYFHPNFAGGGYGVSCHRFIDCVSDYTLRHSYYMNRTNGSLYDVTWHRPVFMQAYTAANTYSPFYFVAPGGTTMYRMIVETARHHSNMNNHKYIAEFSGGGTLADSLFINNRIPTGSTGTYNGIPYSFIDRDIAFTLQDYQTQSGGWASPTWVGTPSNGQTVTVYNSTSAASRIYTYTNGGWHYSAVT